MPNHRRAPFTVTAAAALAGLAVLPASPLLLRDRLPDPLATHWSGGESPDGHLSFTATLVSLAALWLVFCAVAAGFGTSGWGRRSVRAGTGAVLGLGAGLTAGVTAATLRANLDRTSWRDAAPLGWDVAALVLAGAALAAAAGWALGRTGPDVRDPRPAEADAPVLPLAAGERAVWIGHVHSRWAVALGGVLAVGGALAALLCAVLPEPLTPGRPVALVPLGLALVGLAGIVLSSARVAVDTRGLTVAFGPFGRPARSIALDRIALAWAEDRSPAEVGGWGYRTGARGTTVMLRGGACLAVRHDGDREFAVSVDDAERAAAVLNALRDREGSAA